MVGWLVWLFRVLGQVELGMIICDSIRLVSWLVNNISLVGRFRAGWFSLLVWEWNGITLGLNEV